MADDTQDDATQADFGGLINSIFGGMQGAFGFGKVMSWAQNNLVMTLLAVMGVIIRGGTRIGTEFAKGFQAVLEQDNAEIGRLAVTMVGLMFGRDISDEIPGGILNPGNLDENAQAVGAAILESVFGPLALEGGTLAPGVERAEAYLGAITNMVTRGFALDMIEEMVPEPWRLGFVHHLEEDLISGLGLGRIARTVIRPIVQTLVAEPALWAVNLAYRPKLHAPADAVRLNELGLLDDGALDDELGRQGWSASKIEDFKELHLKSADAGALFTLLDHNVASEDDVKNALLHDGYLLTAAEQKIQAHQLARLEPWLLKEADEWLSKYKAGLIDQGVFIESLRSTQLPDDVLQLIATIGGAHRETPRRLLSSGELITAWQNQVLTQNDVHDGLLLIGYSDADATTLILTQLMIGRHKDEAAQAKRDAAAARAAAQAQAKADRLAAERQARLDAAAERAKKAAQLAGEKAQAKADAERRREFIADAAQKRAALVEAAHEAGQISADHAAALKAQIDADEKALLAQAASQAADSLASYHTELLALKRDDREADTAQQLADVDMATQADAAARQAGVAARLSTVDSLLAIKLQEIADLFTARSRVVDADLASSIAVVDVKLLPTKDERAAAAAHKIAEADATLTQRLADIAADYDERDAAVEDELAQGAITAKAAITKHATIQTGRDQATRLAQSSHDATVQRLKDAAATDAALTVATAAADKQALAAAAEKTRQQLAADRTGAQLAAHQAADAEKLRLHDIGAQLGPLSTAAAAKAKAKITAHDAAVKRQETVEATTYAHADAEAKAAAARATGAVQAARARLQLLAQTSAGQEAAAAAAAAQLAAFDADVEARRRQLEAEIAGHATPPLTVNNPQ